jgi:acetylornithine deacetylase
MHADDEYVSVEDYMTAIKVMALSICDWSGIDGSG